MAENKNYGVSELEKIVELVFNEVKKKLIPSNTLSIKSESINNDKITKKAPPSVENLASYIDHTLLKPDATNSEIEKICLEAIKYNFKTVCVNSCNIKLAAKLLEGKKPIPIAVVGFPLGAAVTSSKAFETTEAINDGAKEIDMVINIGALKEKNYLYVLNDIKAVVKAAKPYPVKVILETGSITKEEIIIASALSKAAEAAFVKTSTGFGKGGAKAEDITLMRSVVGPNMGVKASGGIRTTKDALIIIEAGANRIGASSSIEIVSEQNLESKN